MNKPAKHNAHLVIGLGAHISQIKGQFTKAIVGPQSRVAAMAENAKALNANGTNRFDNYQTYFNNKGGTGNEYLTARIARDRPDILADMKAVIEIKFARQKSADITFFFVDIRSL